MSVRALRTSRKLKIKPQGIKNLTFEVLRLSPLFLELLSIAYVFNKEIIIVAIQKSNTNIFIYASLCISMENIFAPKYYLKGIIEKKLIHQSSFIFWCCQVDQGNMLNCLCFEVDTLPLKNTTIYVPGLVVH